MSTSISAFCPGHVTAFFEICDQANDPLRKGSRGAGMSLTVGAKSKVTIEEGKSRSIDVRINGEESRADTTVDAVHRLMGDRKVVVEVDTSLDLPMEQGFGMSAAGALSASLALCSLLGVSQEKAFEAAHIAEVNNRTGLGDIAGIQVGGVEIRLEPGLLPFGRAERIEAMGDVVLAVVGEPMKTSLILSDPAVRRRISAAGKKCTEEFDAGRSLEQLFALGVEFVEDAELSSKEVLESLVVADSHGMASMAMLGNSLFCMGDTAELVDDLKRFGPVFTCAIDQEGPRLI
jgi:pantoate kinase